MRDVRCGIDRGGDKGEEGFKSKLRRGDVTFYMFERPNVLRRGEGEGRESISRALPRGRGKWGMGRGGLRGILFRFRV